MSIGVAFLNNREQDGDPALMAETGFFTHTSGRSADQTPDLQLMHSGLKFMSPQYDQPGNGFTFAPALLQPYSRGTVALRSADPGELALVRPEYLSDSRDVDVLVEGIELSRELAHSRAYARWVKQELAPGDGAHSRSDLVDYIRANASTLWHPVGTCAMGTGDDAVVDAELRVRGVSNLRVADASVMPTIVAGNTNAACIMIGEKAADLIRAARTSPEQEPAHA
jgi:choline dehydrogenase